MYTSSDFNQGIDQMELSELIDIKFLQEYQDAFSEMRTLQQRLQLRLSNSF